MSNKIVSKEDRTESKTQEISDKVSQIDEITAVLFPGVDNTVTASLYSFCVGVAAGTLVTFLLQFLLCLTFYKSEVNSTILSTWSIVIYSVTLLLTILSLSFIGVYTGISQRIRNRGDKLILGTMSSIFVLSRWGDPSLVASAFWENGDSLNLVIDGLKVITYNFGNFSLTTICVLMVIENCTLRGLSVGSKLRSLYIQFSRFIILLAVSFALSVANLSIIKVDYYASLILYPIVSILIYYLVFTKCVDQLKIGKTYTGEKQGLLVSLIMLLYFTLLRFSELIVNLSYTAEQMQFLTLFSFFVPAISYVTLFLLTETE